MKRYGTFRSRRCIAEVVKIFAKKLYNEKWFNNRMLIVVLLLLPKNASLWFMARCHAILTSATNLVTYKCWSKSVVADSELNLIEENNIVKDAEDNMEKRLEEATRKLSEVEEKLQVQYRLLEQQVAETKLFYTIARFTHDDLTLTEALQHFVDAVCSLCSWPVGHIYAPTKNNPNELQSLDIWHLDNIKKYKAFKELSEKTKFKKGIGLPGRILESGKSAWIEDVFRDINFPRAKMGREIGVRGAFAVPIKCYDKFVAIAEFFSSAPRQKNRHLLDLIDTAALQLESLLERRQAEALLRGIVDLRHRTKLNNPT